MFEVKLDKGTKIKTLESHEVLSLVDDDIDGVVNYINDNDQFTIYG